MILSWRNAKSGVVVCQGRRRKEATAFLGRTLLYSNPGFPFGPYGGGHHVNSRASVGKVFSLRVAFSELASLHTSQSQKTCSTGGSDVAVCPQRNATAKFLDRVKSQRIPAELVTKKVEEHLLLCLTEGNKDQHSTNNQSSSNFSLALKLLNEAAEYHEKLPSGENVMPRLFSLACQIMVRSGHPNAFDEVHRQLLRLLNDHKRYLRATDLTYNTHHVNDACSQLIHHVAMDAIRKKQKLDHRRTSQINCLLQLMEELYKDSSVALVADAVAFDAYIMFLCGQHKPQEAYEILRWMVKRSPSHPVELIPPVSSFTSIINGFAKTFEPEKALGIIQWMLTCQEGGTPSLSSIVPPPNETCFNALLHAYAMAGGKGAGRKAEQTMEWMRRLYDTENLNTKPNETSFNICINAWAQSQHPDAPIYAEALLRRLVELHDAGAGVLPSEEAYTAVMNAWANSSKNNAVERVEAILDLMEHAAENTDQLRMSSVPYTVLIKAWEKAAQHWEVKEKVKCEDKALQVLNRMQEKGVTVSTGTHNAILSALVATSALNAMFYFLELEQQYRDCLLQMDTTSFNSGLNAIAALNRPDAVGKATSVLTRMFEYSEVDICVRPSTSTFNIILKVLSRSSQPDAPAKAEALLQEMTELQSVAPDFISYLTCIIAWGRSDHSDKYSKVADLVHRFVALLDKKGLGERGTAIAVFNAALSVCHHNSTPELANEALNTACIVMSTLRQVEGLRPDQSTYTSWFRAFTGGVSGVIPNETVMGQFLDEFVLCINDGLVTRDVIQTVQKIAPHALEEVAGKEEEPETFAIPQSWSKNVKGSRRSLWKSDRWSNPIAP